MKSFILENRGSRKQSRHDAGLLQTLIYTRDICRVQLSRNLGVNGYINSSVMMNQSQLLREAAASGISFEQPKTGPCSSIKHEMKSGDWEIKGG